MTDELATMDATAQAELVRSGEASPSELVDAAIERIEALNGELNAVIHPLFDRAREEASGELPDGPFRGVPMLHKDLGAHFAGEPYHEGIKHLRDLGWTEPRDSWLAQRWCDAGLVSCGKTNTPELGILPTTEPEAHGPSRNPWDLGHSTGGSSGGSAAAVAAGMVPVALGSDTGGSIRQPAALCGVTGLKPTWGRVSRYGLIAFASSLDQIGPIARTVEDAALVLRAIAGPDPCDATAAEAPVADYAAALDGDSALQGTSIAIPRRLLDDGVDEGVRQAFDRAVDALASRGAKIVDVELPHSRHAIAIYYLIATAEASSNLARYDGVRYGVRAPRDAADTLAAMYEQTRQAGFGPEVKRRIMLGTYVLSAGYYDAYYVKAQQVRTLIRQDFERALASADVVAPPTSPTPAFRFGERTADPLKMYLADVFTVSAPLAGLPAISVPCGFADRLPVGLQLVGRPFDEATILRIAHAYERGAEWWKAMPPVSG
jgi:aspartyl-tRNA(Asn)/glutamyl-tRNA(Gln) amidotransferase subunit A